MNRVLKIHGYDEVLRGTASEIVREMSLRAMPFPGGTLREYVDWILPGMSEAVGAQIKLAPVDVSEEALCDALLDAAVRYGFALELCAAAPTSAE